MPPKPQAPRTVTISKTNLTLQELNTRDLTSEGVDRIVNFFVKNDVFYLARRSADGTTTTLAAFDLKDGTLYPHREFGVKGVVTLKNQKLFGLTLGENGDIYYVRKSVHTLRDGNDIESLKGQTTATRIALLPVKTRPISTATTISPLQISKMALSSIIIRPSCITAPNLLPAAYR